MNNHLRDVHGPEALLEGKRRYRDSKSSATIVEHCHICKAPFTQRRNLYRHMRDRHSDEDFTASLQLAIATRKRKLFEKKKLIEKDAFLSVIDFDNLFEIGAAIAWEDLPKDVVYYVHKLNILETKWGEGTILHLQNKFDKVIIKVRTPNAISDILRTRYERQDSDSSHHAYIKPFGEKEADVVFVPDKKKKKIVTTTGIII